MADRLPLRPLRRLALQFRALACRQSWIRVKYVLGRAADEQQVPDGPYRRRRAGDRAVEQLLHRLANRARRDVALRPYRRAGCEAWLAHENPLREQRAQVRCAPYDAG